jgi:hypothetical protein
MSSISGLSASLGIGFDELGSAMSIISKTQTESVAATQLKAAMAALLKPNSEMSAALKTLNVQSGATLVKQYGLAESISVVKTALGGTNEGMAKALPSSEALQAAIELTADKYKAFAKEYSQGLSGAAAAALEAQSQSYEARVAKLQATSDSLKIQMGDDINTIKGFFVDMGAGFLTHVVSPVMSSPLDGVFQGIAAGAGLAAKSVLDMGSGALNAATQLVVLTAAVQNAGGFAKLFGHSLSLTDTPFKMAGGLAMKAIGPIIAFGASLWTALVPILPFIAAGAALAALGIFLVKNWNAVSSFFTGVFTKIQGFLAGVCWFGATVELGKAELAKANENKLAAAAAKPAETATITATAAPPPATASPVVPPAITTAGAIAVPEPAADFDQEARASFAEALRPTQTQTAQTPWNAPREKQTKKERANFTIQNLTLQCDDIKNMFDLYSQLEMIFANSVEAAV